MKPDEFVNTQRANAPLFLSSPFVLFLSIPRKVESNNTLSLSLPLIYFLFFIFYQYLMIYSLHSSCYCIIIITSLKEEERERALKAHILLFFPFLFAIFPCLHFEYIIQLLHLLYLIVLNTVSLSSFFSVLSCHKKQVKILLTFSVFLTIGSTNPFGL